MHWKLSSKAKIASDFSTSYASNKAKNENDAIRNRIPDFDKRRVLNQKPDKQASHE